MLCCRCCRRRSDDTTSVSDWSGNKSAASFASSSSSSLSSLPPRRRSPSCRDLRLPIHLLLYLLPLISVIYFILLPERPLVSQGVYTDENAILLANSANGIHDAALMRLHVDAREARRKEQASVSSTQWLLNEIALTLPLAPIVSTQYTTRFETSYPTSNVTTQIHTVLFLAPKGDGKEAVVVGVEYAADSSAASNHISIDSVQLLLEYMTHFTRQGYEAASRDFLLVFVESHTNLLLAERKYHSTSAVGEWFRQYHSSSSNRLIRSGVLRFALFLDYDGMTAWDSVSLDVVGQNGAQPNLDLPSIILKAFGNQGAEINVAETVTIESVNTDKLELFQTQLTSYFPFLHKSFYSAFTPNEHTSVWSLPDSFVQSLGIPRSDIPQHGRWDSNLGRWKGIWRFMLQAISGGLPSTGAYHAQALKYGIDSATIRGVPIKAPHHPRPNTLPHEAYDHAFRNLRALESSLHVTHKLIEKLHHSTWWYILSTREDFVTMSKYIYVAVLSLGMLPLYGLYLLILFQTSHQSWLREIGVILSTIYVVAVVGYCSPKLVWQLMNTNATEQRAWRGSWMIFMTAVLAVATIVIYLATRPNRKSSASNSSSASIIPLIDRHHATIHLSPDARKQLASTESRPHELPFSPAYLPLLPPQLHRLTPAPIFRAGFDWRVLYGVELLLIGMTLTPVMVMNYSICLLTLVWCVPIVLWTNGILSTPNQWWSKFRGLKQQDGTRASLHTMLVWEWIKYAWRRIAHLSVLILASPLSMILLYSQFHSIPLESSLNELLSYCLLRDGNNLLVYTFWFCYFPLFAVSALMFAGTSEVVDTKAEEAKETKKSL